MYRNLFTAWYCLGVLTLSLVAFLIALPFIGVGKACGNLGILGLLGLLPIFTMTRFRVFRNEKYDERDYVFLQKSLLVGFCNGFASIVAVSSLIHHIFFVWLAHDSIPLHFFMLPSACGVTIGLFAFSILMLRLYYKGDTPVYGEELLLQGGEQ
jgi:cadmium resistance protein CadD (predicted permease)